jgi:hypothetical protein
MLEDGGAVKEIKPPVASAVDRDASALVTPEVKLPTATPAGGNETVTPAAVKVTVPAVLQARGGEVETPAAPEASTEPQEAANLERPNFSGDDITAFWAELEQWLSGPEEPAAEASETPALGAITMVEAVGVNPEEPVAGAAETELAVVASPTTVASVEVPTVIVWVEASPQLAAPEVVAAPTVILPCVDPHEHVAPADAAGNTPSEIQEVGERSGRARAAAPSRARGY